MMSNVGIYVEPDALGYQTLGGTREGDAGLDLVAQEDGWIIPNETLVVPTGVHLDLPEDMAALVCPRSGLATKGVTVVNAPGIVDPNYTGEVKVILAALALPVKITAGDRIAQLVFHTIPTHTIERLSDLPNKQTARGAAGFGSSGR